MTEKEGVRSMFLTTNELVDILRTYSSANDEGVGSGNNEFETEHRLLSKIKEEMKKRGATETCGYCHLPLYVDKPQPEHKGMTFCFGRCKELWMQHHEPKERKSE